MKKTNFAKRILSAVICFMLIAAMAFLTTACDNKEVNSTAGESSSNNGDTNSSSAKHYFTFKVTDKDGKSTTFEITTDKKTVGEALLDEKLIEGEEGQYGLYVKKVNGIVADYNVDGTYWAFYENGEYAVSGVDTTEIKDGTTYEFRVSK